MSTNKKVCFIIGRIGEDGTEARKYADYFRKLIVKPAVEALGYEVTRGDMQKGAPRLYDDVKRSIQEMDLCVCDISMENPMDQDGEFRFNPNVYYELGYRDASGMPTVLLKHRNLKVDRIPADIRDRKTIDYDLEDLDSICKAVEDLQDAVIQIQDSNVNREAGASLMTIAATLNRLERKLVLMEKNMDSNWSSNERQELSVDGMPISRNDDALAGFAVAVSQGNIPMMEAAMERLQHMMDPMKFLDQIVEVAASIGSRKAGEILVDKVHTFMDSDTTSFHQKIEYLGSMVSYLNRYDKEMEYVSLVEEIADVLEGKCADENPEDISQIFNQKNRLYHGIYATTDDEQYLNKAIEALLKAKEYVPDSASHLYYNLALCYRAKGNIDEAEKNIKKAVEINQKQSKHDVDHLLLACQIYKETENEDFESVYAALSEISPVKAALVKLNRT